jgi:alkylation response protein AidB-like acyl-CoA dehydrogenase
VSLLKLNNEQNMIRNEFRKFAISEIEPTAEEIENQGRFPKTIVGKLAELGLLGLIIPEQYGGVELDLTSLCIAAEEISKVSASIGTTLVVNNCMVAYPLMKFGNEEQKEKHLNRLAEGEIGGYICEPEIDLPEEKNDLKQDSGNLFFSGHRELILNGEAAEFYIFPIQTKEFSKYFILEKSVTGLFPNSKNLLGLRTAGFMNSEFQGLPLQNENSFPMGNDKLNYSQIKDITNIGFSAVSLGIAQACLEASIKYAQERIQFGKSISKYAAIRDILAEMKTKIETARLLVYEAASRFDNSEDYSTHAKIARIIANETGYWCGLNAIQVHGGYGYMKDYPLERFFRDAKVIQHLEASSRVMKLDIARQLLK